MRIVAIVQAQMTSPRLPGKALADVSGRPILDWVIRRISDAKVLDEVVVATGDTSADDPVAERCQALGVRCIRGDDADVLARFLLAAQGARADVIVRVTADSPFTDPEIIDLVARRFAEEKAEYASNALVASFPKGLGVEVFSRKALEASAKDAKAPEERADVTAFMKRHPERFRHLSVPAENPHPKERWTVEAAEDLELMRAIVSRLPNRDEFGWRDILAVLDREPQLRAINAHVK